MAALAGLHCAHFQQKFPLSLGVCGSRSRGGYGLLLAEGGHFVLNRHMINRAAETTDAAAAVQLLLVVADEVDFPAAPLTCISMDVALEPGNPCDSMSSASSLPRAANRRWRAFPTPLQTSIKHTRPGLA